MEKKVPVVHELLGVGQNLHDHFSTDNAQWFTLFSGPIDVPLYQFGIFGAILVAVMLFRPEGLIPSSRRAAELHEDPGAADQPLYDVTHE